MIVMHVRACGIALAFSIAALGTGGPPPASATGEAGQAPVGWWRFEEGSGPVTRDSSGNALDGAVLGPAFTADPAPVGGGAFSLSFDGAGDFVRVPHSERLEFRAGDPLTVAAWIKKDSFRRTWHVLGKRDECGAVNFQLARDPQNGVHFTSYGPGSEVFGPSGVSDVPTGVWTHMAATYDPAGHAVQMYVNGVPGRRTTGFVLGGNGSGVQDLRIGTSGECPLYETFPGRIDDVRIYDRVLPASEITAIAGADGLACRAAAAGWTRHGHAVSAFAQGRRKDGAPVVAWRSDPVKALGRPQLAASPPVNFVSLGFGGSIEVCFAHAVAVPPGSRVHVWEYSNPGLTVAGYPEGARVEVSADGTSYSTVGTTSRLRNQAFPLPAHLAALRSVRITDVSDPSGFSAHDADGFDVNAVVVKAEDGRRLAP